MKRKIFMIATILVAIFMLAGCFRTIESNLLHAPMQASLVEVHLEG